MPTPRFKPSPGHRIFLQPVERRGQQRLLCLVIDDDPVSREMAKTQLRTLGLDAMGAGCAQEAMATIEQRRPRIALIDHGLPDDDGYGLARRIRRHEGRFPHFQSRTPMLLVALSALSGGIHVKRCVGVGIDRVLVKPVSLPSLASALGLGTGDPALLFRSAPGVLPATNIEALYRVTCRRDLAALSLAVRAQDWRLASQLAHRIRGASQILGANAIAGIASVLERMDGDRAANADLHALALRWLSRLLDPGQDSASRPP